MAAGLQTQLAAQENTLVGRIALEREHTTEVAADGRAALTGLRSELLQSVSVVAGELTKVAGELNAAVDGVDAKLGAEVGQQSEMFKALCLEVAKDTDSKVGQVDGRLTATIGAAPAFGAPGIRWQRAPGS